jgi:hypothetical protein
MAIAGACGRMAIAGACGRMAIIVTSPGIPRAISAGIADRIPAHLCLQKGADMRGKLNCNASPGLSADTVTKP